MLVEAHPELRAAVFRRLAERPGRFDGLPPGVVDEWFANPRNRAFTDGEDVALFEREEEGRWHVHILFRQVTYARLKAFMAAAQQVARTEEVTLFYAAIPEKYLDCRLVARQIGARYLGTITRDNRRERLYEFPASDVLAWPT